MRKNRKITFLLILLGIVICSVLTMNVSLAKEEQEEIVAQGIFDVKDGYCMKIWVAYNNTVIGTRHGRDEIFAHPNQTFVLSRRDATEEEEEIYRSGVEAAKKRVQEGKPVIGKQCFGSNDIW